MKGKNKKLEKIEKAIEKIEKLNNVKISKELSFNFNPFRESYRYFDLSGREYKFSITEKGKIFVKVIPAKGKKNLDLKEGGRGYIIFEDKIYRKVDEEIIFKFVSQFLKKRNFSITEENFLRLINNKKFEIFINGHSGEIEIIKTKPFVEVILRDKEKDKPYFCSKNHQYIFKIKSIIEVGKEEDIFISYEESEIATTTLSPTSLLRRVIYGFSSYNLRNFYSDEGIFPEVKHSIKQVVYGNLAGSIVVSSVFVRVAERLKGNTWYTLASGILAFIRAPAEIYFMKKSLKLTEDFPSSMIKKFFEKGKIKEVFESKEIKVWRNFEREIFDIFKNKEDFVYLLEKYSDLKFQIYKLVEYDQKEKIYEILKNELSISDKEIEKLGYFVEHLKKIDIDKIAEDIKKEIKYFYENEVLKPGGEYMFFKYIDEIFKENIVRLPVNKTFKLLNDRIKEEERELTREEVVKFINMSKRKLEPFRFLDLFTFFSLFVMGYSASFLKGMKEITVLIYYIFYGAITNIILAAINRYGGQVGFQYIYRTLESAPNLTSAADAWNEFNSHVMRLWAVFSSLGVIIGILGKLFSDISFGISRYFVEGVALILYIMAIREWFLYYENLEKRSKLGE